MNDSTHGSCFTGSHEARNVTGMDLDEFTRSHTVCFEMTGMTSFFVRRFHQAESCALFFVDPEFVKFDAKLILYGNIKEVHLLGLFLCYSCQAFMKVHVEGLSLIHISEPTRLLSISYAVFCLKK